VEGGLYIEEGNKEGLAFCYWGVEARRTTINRGGEENED
jgi:hypothetical protein